MEFSRINKRDSFYINIEACSSRDQHASWSSPPENFWKLNVDAVWSSSPHSNGFGVICRDSAGLIRAVFALSLDVDFKAPIVELRAIVEGI